MQGGRYRQSMVCKKSVGHGVNTRVERVLWRRGRRVCPEAMAEGGQWEVMELGLG